MKKIIIFILLFCHIFLFGNIGILEDHFTANAKIGDVGHWRDSTGSQIPGTTFGAFNFNQEIRNDGIYTKPNNSTVQLSEAGDYLIIATTRDNDTSNGRYNPQLRIAQIAGTGDIFSSYYSGYSRDNSENQAWTRAIGIVIGASLNSQIQVQKRRDSDAPLGGSVVNASDIQVIRLNQTNYGIYAIGGTGNTYGGTSPNTLSIDNIISESDTSAIEGNTGTDTVLLKGDNKKYLVAWSSSFNVGGARTQRIGHLEYNGVDELSTRSYCYARSSLNEYCGLGSMDLLQTSTADISIQAEVFRGVGVANNQGGANSDGSLVTDGNGQMIVLEMPEYLEAFRSEDSQGLQNLSSAQTLNIARDVDIVDAASFTKDTNTLVNVVNPADIFSWTNIWTARGNVASGSRQTSYGSITINGIEQTVGRHGNYSRGNQSTTDTFGLGFQPAGIYTTTGAGSTLGVNSTPLPGGEVGGIDQTQAGTLGFFTLNLDTFIEPEFTQSHYRWFQNVDSTDVGSALAAQDTPAILASDGASFRLRSLLSVSENQLRLNETNFKLQFAERVGTCDTSFLGEVYADVNNTSPIAFHNNASPSDEDALTANGNDPINGLANIVNQSYQEGNSFSTSIAAIPEDENGKWDFSLIDNTAPDDTNYCFRVVESDNSLLDNYDFIPEIQTFSNTPILSVIKTDNDIDDIVQTNQVVRYSIELSNSGSAATGISINDTIDTDYGAPYNFMYSNCGSPVNSFLDPTLTFSSLSVGPSETCTIEYDLQVDSGAAGGNTINNSADASAAAEGGNDPAAASADTLTILACGINDIEIQINTDNWGEDTYWSLTPNGNACGVGEMANGGNTIDLTCASGGAQSANAANGYADNSTISEGPYSLNAGIQYDLHIIDDWGDGMTGDPDVTIQQNGSTTDTFIVGGTGGVFPFTVQEPSGCIDTISPDLTINQASSQVDPSSVDSAMFQVVFNEVIDIASFSSTDINLSGTTGTVTSGPTEISPNNGTSFEFTVTGMTSGDTVTASIPAGVIQDLAGNFNTASTSVDNQITYIGGDTTPPVVTSTSFLSGALLPGGNHTITLDYTDTESTLDTATANIILNKWDGVSAWGPDISASGLDLGSSVVGTGSASYPTLNLTFGKYRYIFSIDDSAGNTGTIEREFYIDTPELIVGSGSIDIGTLNHSTNTFSDTLTVSVLTVGAPFDLTFSNTTLLNYDTESIPTWNGSQGFGFQQSPYGGTISPINTNELLASEPLLINTNGEKNIYSYEIQIGALIDIIQASGDYLGDLKFDIDLQY